MPIWMDSTGLTEKDWPPEDSTSPDIRAFRPPPFEECWRSERLQQRDGELTRFRRIKSPFVGNRWLPDISFNGVVSVKRQTKARDDQGRLWIRSMISTPDIDSTNERLAWDVFLESMPLFMERPRMLAFHDMRQPIGNWPRFNISEEGTLLEGFVSAGRPDIQQFVMDDMLDSSVGFLMEEAIWNEELEIVEVIKGRLFEGSLVPIPANESVWVEVLSGFKQFAPGSVVKRKVEDSESEKAPEAEREILVPSFPDEGELDRCVESIGGVMGAVTVEVAAFASEVLAGE